MPITYEDAYLDDCLDDKRDVLIQSAFRCVDSIRKEEAKRQKEAFAKKTRIVKPVDFSPDYWKKWKRDNRKALVNQIKARERRCYAPHYGRVTPLHQIGPSLSFCSKYARLKGTVPFSQPPLLSSQNNKPAQANEKGLGGGGGGGGGEKQGGRGSSSGNGDDGGMNVFAELKIDSDFLERFAFLGLDNGGGDANNDGKKRKKKKKHQRSSSSASSSSSPSSPSSTTSSHHHQQQTSTKVKKPHQSTTASSRGISFGRSTRDEWNRMCAPQSSTNMMVSPAAYDVQTGLKATLPNHGTFIFTGLKNAVEKKIEEKPGPGHYDTSSYRTRPIRPITFLRAPREEIGGGSSSSKEKAPGPQDYHVKPPLPHVPTPAFNGIWPYERPSSGNDDERKMRGIEKLEGFGHQCDFAQHVCYGKCLDEGCSERGLFEQTRARLVESKRKKQMKKEEEERLKNMRVMMQQRTDSTCSSVTTAEAGGGGEGEENQVDEHGLIKPIIIQAPPAVAASRRRSSQASTFSSCSLSTSNNNMSLVPTSTTLHHAVQRRELAIVDRLLKEETCDINARDPELRTPLHWAAEVGDFRIAKRLVENDLHPFITPKGFVHPRVAPKLDLVDKKRDSVMHLATRGGHWYIVELLYKAGAKCDLKNDKGATPIDDAKTNALCSKLLGMMEVDKAREELRLVQMQVKEAKDRAAAKASAASS